MNTWFKLAGALFISLLTLGLVAACGGGGGGGGNPGFTGVQSQAVIDDNNAQQLVLDAYNGAMVTDQLVVPLGGDNGLNQRLAPLGRILFDSLPTLDFAPTVTPLATSEVQGPCGGTATVSITEGSTTASGSVVYTGYCDGGVVLDGTVTFSAVLNTQTNDVSLTMNFAGLTNGDGSLSGSVSMYFNIQDTTAPMTMTMDMIVTDAQDRTYWIDDYTIVITPGTTQDTANFSGTFHDFDAGYVTITTSDPLLVDNATGVIESGTLHFAGSEGTYADLTATGGGNYTLTVSTGTVINGTF